MLFDPDQCQMTRFWVAYSDGVATDRDRALHRDLELSVIDADGPHPLVFPCQRVVSGWLKSGTKDRVDVHPTHWRDWQKLAPSLSCDA